MTVDWDLADNECQRSLTLRNLESATQGLVCVISRKIGLGPDSVASTRVQGWGDEPCQPTVRLPDWSELVASYSRMKSAWGWANGGQPILVCYIRKYVIIFGGIFPLTSPQPKYWGGVSPAGLTPVPRFTKYLTVMPELLSTYNGRLIYHTSYEERDAFLFLNVRFTCKIVKIVGKHLRKISARFRSRSPS